MAQERRKLWRCSTVRAPASRAAAKRPPAEQRMDVVDVNDIGPHAPDRVGDDLLGVDAAPQQRPRRLRRGRARDWSARAPPTTWPARVSSACRSRAPRVPRRPAPDTGCVGSAPAYRGRDSGNGQRRRSSPGCSIALLTNYLARLPNTALRAARSPPRRRGSLLRRRRAVRAAVDRRRTRRPDRGGAVSGGAAGRRRRAAFALPARYRAVIAPYAGGRDPARRLPRRATPPPAVHPVGVGVVAAAIGCRTRSRCR